MLLYLSQFSLKDSSGLRQLPNLVYLWVHAPPPPPRPIYTQSLTYKRTKYETYAVEPRLLNTKAPSEYAFCKMRVRESYSAHTSAALRFLCFLIMYMMHTRTSYPLC